MSFVAVMKSASVPASDISHWETTEVFVVERLAPGAEPSRDQWNPVALDADFRDACNKAEVLSRNDPGYAFRVRHFVPKDAGFKYLIPNKSA